MNRSIIIAAVVVSAAILLNGYLDRAGRSTHLLRPSDQRIREEVTKSFRSVFATEGDNIIMERKRDIRDIQIRGIHFSEGDSRMLVDFTLLCADGDKIASGIAFERDAFGTYRGAWGFGQKQAHFEVTPKA
jgi:hypothetical protein